VRARRIAGGVAGIALVVVLIVLGARERVHPVAPTSSTSLHVGGSALRLEPDTEEGDASLEIRRAAQVTSPNAEEPPPSLPRSEPFDGAFVVRLVFADGSPAPGARVETRSRPSGRTAWLEHHERSAGQPDPWIAHGAVADDDGRVHLARRSVFVDVRAHGERGGALHAGMTEALLVGSRDALDEAQVLLHPAISVAVRVVDVDGAAVAGVPVHVVRADDARSAMPLDRGITDASGHARLADESAKTREALARGESLVVRAGGVFSRVVETAYDDRGTIELVLPPHGRVDVHVPSLITGVRIATLASSLQANVRRGIASFPHVEVDVDLVATATVLGKPLSPESFRGPQTAGATLEHHWGALEGFGELVDVRLVDERGEPFRERAVEIHRSGPRSSTTHVSHTARDGRLTVDLEGHERVHFCVLSDARFGSRRGIASGALPRSRIEALAGPRRDAGDVVLRVQPLLAAGRVVDASGRAIEGATVRISGGGNASPWRTDPTAPSDVTGDDGAFAITGEILAETFPLAVEAAGLSMQGPRVVTVGDHDVVLVVGAGARMAVRLRMPQGLDSRAIEVRLTTSGSTRVLFPDHVERPAGGMPLELLYTPRDLPPGPATLTAHAIAQKEETLRIEAELRRGETIDLGSHDLERSLATMEVAVLDEEGAHLGEARVSLVTGDVRRVITFGAASPVRLARPADGSFVEAYAHGYIGARAPAAQERVELRLARSRPVTVRLPSGYPAPPPGEWVKLAATAPDGFEWPTAIGERNRVTIGFAGPGKYTFTALDALGRRRSPSSTVELRIDTDAIDAAIELPFALGEWQSILDRLGALER
jgi:hypothetical protein